MFWKSVIIWIFGETYNLNTIQLKNKMPVTHKWSVHRMEQLNDDSGTVVRVDYIVNSTDGDNSIQSHGTVELEVENIENFIPYENLSEEIVINWIKIKLGPSLGGHEINNSAWIESIINPPSSNIILTELPWQKIS